MRVVRAMMGAGYGCGVTGGAAVSQRYLRRSLEL
jgi:hypothetical protein